MTQRTVLVTGAGRGLGLEFVRQYAAAGDRVFATVRDPASATALADVSGAVSIHALDMTDRDALAAFPGALDAPSIDIAVLNAGVMGERVLDADGGTAWLDVLAVNSVAPTLLALALLPKLRAAGGRMVAITSQMGSIADNASGGFVPYRSSKAALNAAWRSLGVDWQAEPVALAVLHPGWVQTDMGGPGAPTQPVDSIAGMRAVIDGLNAGSGCPFLDFTGKTLPW